MFYRNAIQELRAWASRPGHKPLVLRGARQVGKTTLVDEFAKEYAVYLRLNLEKASDRRLFDADMPMDELVSAIYLLNNKERLPARTLLFIDEIQNSPRAVALLRYFYEEVEGIDVIAAGSLLESLIDRHISFPVGRVEYMAVRPCSFNEFLGALGDTGLQEAQRQAAVPLPLHEECARLFQLFTVVGGMPEAVSAYAENRDFVALRSIYETLLDGYRDDVEKYSASDSARNVIRHILNVGWANAARRITFERFGNSSYRSREIGDAFRTLEKTMLLELVYPTTQTQLPLMPEPKRAPKLLWLDTGLVNHAVGLQRELLETPDICDVWTGAVAEHVVGQELLGDDFRFSSWRCFWVNGTGSEAEVDFVFQHAGRIVPVEVKAGHNSRLRSLHRFMEKAPHDLAVRFWSRPVAVDEVTTPGGKRFRLLNLPYYYAGRLEAALEKWG